MRFEGLAGEFSQHDFGEVVVQYQDHTQEKVHFCASQLKYSRWVEVTIVRDQRVESLVRTLVDHLAAFGGIPLVAVFDRPKTVALKWGRDGVVTEWNPTFAAVVLDLGLGVEVCWPYRPQEKGAVENLVGWVKGSFFKQRRFLDREDRDRQLREWLVDVNTVRPSRATGVPPATRMGEERERLRPLKVRPDELALRIPVSAGPTGVIVHDRHPYSMPPEAIGVPGTLFLYRDHVRIIAGRFTVEHERRWLAGEGSIRAEHRAQHAAAVSGERARRYLQRQQLLALGVDALAYLTELTHRRTRTWIHDVEQLHSLLQTYGDAALRAAFTRGLAERAIGAEYIARTTSTPPSRPCPSISRTVRRRYPPRHARAEGGSRSPTAPGGAAPSAAPGRVRARAYPVVASEAGHDAARRSRPALQAPASRSPGGTKRRPPAAATIVRRRGRSCSWRPCIGGQSHARRAGAQPHRRSRRGPTALSASVPPSRPHVASTT